MRNDEERSYERYKQYRRNKYRYEQEQILFPAAIIIVGSFLIGFWKYILIAVGVGVAILVLYLRKQLSSDQPIILTEKDARDGVNAIARITYNSKTVCVETTIPPNAKDGQKIVVRNVLFENKKGKPIKKNVHLTIQVKKS